VGLSLKALLDWDLEPASLLVDEEIRQSGMTDQGNRLQLADLA
jgi:hypothetical protein